LTRYRYRHSLSLVKAAKPKARRIIGIDADDPRLPPAMKRRIRKWTSEPVTHRFKTVEAAMAHLRSVCGK
jgi:hypothetical protein